MTHARLCAWGALWCAAILAVAGCAVPQATPSAKESPHMGDAWYAHRAKTLSITPKEARARDAALPDGEGPPPFDKLDAHTATEAAVIWRDLCASCHGSDGKPPEGVGEPVPRSWGFGARMGFTFGGDKMRQSLYTTISKGKPPAMPAWGETLSREQRWALVRHLEGF